MTLQHIRWSPGIGDPTIIGWVTVVAYLVCAVLCFWAASRRISTIYLQEEVEGNPKKFWVSMGVLLFLLGINKQLDLQSLLMQIVSVTAAQQGWSQYKRLVQIVLIGGLAMMAFVLILFCMRWVRHTHFGVKLGFAGFALLIVFVVIRAASFQHLHLYLGVSFGSARMSWILELLGLGIIFIAALTSLLMPKKQV